MVVLAEKAKDKNEARQMLMETIESGKALNKLKEFVAAQGGDISPIDDTSLFPHAKYVIPVESDRDGVVCKIHSQNIGIIAMELGAGRATKESTIDLAVGLVLNKKRGEKVSKGDVIAYIHANDMEKAEKAKAKILESYVIEKDYEDNIPLIYEVVTK